MKKLIWVDVGTHFGQEYSSIFGSNFNFYYLIFRRIVGGNILNRGKSVKFQELRQVVRDRRRIRKQSSAFYTIFVEANSKIAYSKDVYREADFVFNLALTDESHARVSIAKLYLGNGSELSQGSSVYLAKHNVEKDSYVPAFAVSTSSFFTELELYLTEKYTDYDVLVRLNCEGVEDEVIYSAHNSFGNKLKLVCGSLKDVEGIKGHGALEKLDKFMHGRKILFVDFHSGFESWPRAHAAISKLVKAD